MQTGIDVSKWQSPSKMDYGKIAEKESFLIARATYGVKSDATFERHLLAARFVGMKVGAYHFYRQSQPWAAQLDAFEGELERVQLGTGDIVPVVDLEWNDRYDGKVKPAHFRKGAQAMMDGLRARYGDCMVYIAPAFYRALGEPEWLLEFPWWIAHYTTASAPDCPWLTATLWQYTGSGRVAGYSHGIDRNRLLGNLPLIGDALSIQSELFEGEHTAPNIEAIGNVCTAREEAIELMQEGITLVSRAQTILEELSK